ncbi:MAG: dehydrogenase E1 component subunit alpha/beta [Flavobacteriia bacterium]|nr:dehydrogenase E1 component subunit alpha/beta [Flavobacteriia bacterium]
MKYNTKELPSKTLISLYKGMLKPRMIEEKMLILLRQGKISKWFSGIGQEAISVGLTMALNEQEYILPMHRNLGVFTSRDIPLYRLFSQWQGKANGFTQGRDRSFHFGSQQHKIIGMISHLGPQLGVADGIALAHKLKKEKALTAVFTGEGATSEGDFHEALNIASVWSLPVLFCVENNGYGLSTPIKEQFNCKHIIDKGIGYGMEAHQIDGNNIVEVYSKISEIAESVREHPRPVLLEFLTFRMRGHEEASGTKYVPEALFEMWQKRDPIDNFEKYLLKKELILQSDIIKIKEQFTTEIQEHLEKAFKEEAITFNESKLLEDVYAPFEFTAKEPSIETRGMRFVDAISNALDQAMEVHSDLVIMGQDIAEYGGAFKITEGFLGKFGAERIRNTPICESGIVETAMGLSIAGHKAIVEMQFADFVSSGFNPIVNYLAKSYFRWGEKANVVIRMPCGAGVGAGPFHSQTNEAWFTKTPGLKVIYPAFPRDAKGLLLAAIEDPNPVMFFEHKGLYRSLSQEVPNSYFTLPIGKATLIKEGTDITVVSYGAGVHWALEIIEKHPNISVDLIDLRSLQPLDWECIAASIKKTAKLIILQEDSMFGGIASDIAATVQEQYFSYLDAPIRRVASLETPIPFAKNLEDGYLSKNRFEKVLLELNMY